MVAGGPEHLRPEPLEQAATARRPENAVSQFQGLVTVRSVKRSKSPVLRVITVMS